MANDRATGDSQRREPVIVKFFFRLPGKMLAKAQPNANLAEKIVVGLALANGV